MTPMRANIAGLPDVPGLRKLGDVLAGVLESDELATARQRDRINYLGCCSVFGLAASAARLAIHASYSGVPRCAVLKGIAFVKSSNPLKTGRVHRRNANDAASGV
jgi:hypothetical protein